MSQKHHEIGLELRPLITLFNDLSDEKLELYCKQLESYDIPTIRKAVVEVQRKWDRVSFPPPGVIVQCCDGLNAKPTGQHHGSNQWEERNEAIRKATMEYFFNYQKTSATYAQAIREKWDYPLDHYLRAVGGLQAQLLNPSSGGNLSVEWHIIEPKDIRPGEASKWRREFLQDMHRQVKFHNCIDVALPINKIQEWQNRASLEQQKYAA